MFGRKEAPKKPASPASYSCDLEDYVFDRYGVFVPYAEIKREMRGQEGLTILSPEFDAAVRRAITYVDCSVDGVVVAF